MAMSFDDVDSEGAVQRAVADAADARRRAAADDAGCRASDDAGYRATGSDVERMLAGYYRAMRPAVRSEAKRAVREAVVQEVRDAIPCCERSVRATAVFVANQARFMGAAAWIGQFAIAAVVLLLAWAARYADIAGVFACLAGVSVAVCGLPNVMASKTFGVMELERTCVHGAREVAAARMAVLAFSNAVVLGVVLAALPKGGSGGATVLLAAFAPYFTVSAGCLLAARRLEGSAALVTAAAWGATVFLAAYELSANMPGSYAAGSAWLWALACAAAFVWMLGEARAWLSAVAQSSALLAFRSPSAIGR